MPSIQAMRILGTFCKPNFGNFDGNGPRPGERCETKWRIFAKIHPNVRLEGPGTEQNFRFGSGWPVRVCPCGHVLRQFGIAGRRINFCSFCLFFNYVIVFEIVELHSVDFVFSSIRMFSSSELQAITTPSISPSHGVVRKPEKVYFVRRKQTVKGKGKEEKKDDVTNHQRKGSGVFLLLCPLPIHPSLSTLPRVKQICCCLVDYQSRPALPCKASQGKEKKTFFLARTTLSLCDSRATGFPPKSSWKSPVASPSELAEPKMKPKINFLFAEQTFGLHMFVCTLTLPGQNPDADLSENRTGFGLQNLPIATHFGNEMPLMVTQKWTFAM